MLLCASKTPSREVWAVCQISLLLEPFVHQHLCYRNVGVTGSVGSPGCGEKHLSEVAATSSPEEAECGCVITV